VPGSPKKVHVAVTIGALLDRDPFTWGSEGTATRSSPLAASRQAPHRGTRQTPGSLGVWDAKAAERFTNSGALARRLPE
jgi:hypothetical protein